MPLAAKNSQDDRFRNMPAACSAPEDAKRKVGVDGEKLGVKF